MKNQKDISYMINILSILLTMVTGAICVCSTVPLSISNVTECTNGNCKIKTVSLVKLNALSTESSCFEVQLNNVTIKKFSLQFMMPHYEAKIRKLYTTGKTAINIVDSKCKCFSPFDDMNYDTVSNVCPNDYCFTKEAKINKFRETQNPFDGKCFLTGDTATRISYGLTFTKDTIVYKAEDLIFKGQMLLGEFNNSVSQEWKEDVTNTIISDNVRVTSVIQEKISLPSLKDKFIVVSKSSGWKALLLNKEHVNELDAFDVNKLGWFKYDNLKKLAIDNDKTKDAVSFIVNSCSQRRFTTLNRFRDPTYFNNDNYDFEKITKLHYRLITEDDNINHYQTNRHLYFNMDQNLDLSLLNPVPSGADSTFRLTNADSNEGIPLRFSETNQCGLLSKSVTGTDVLLNRLDVWECQEIQGYINLVRVEMHFNRGGNNECIFLFHRPNVAWTTPDSYVGNVYTFGSPISKCGSLTINRSDLGITGKFDYHVNSTISTDEYIVAESNAEKEVLVRIETDNVVQFEIGVTPIFNISKCSIKDKRLLVKLESDNDGILYIRSHKEQIISSTTHKVVKGDNVLDVLTNNHLFNETVDISICNKDNNCSSCNVWVTEDVFVNLNEEAKLKTLDTHVKDVLDYVNPWNYIKTTGLHWDIVLYVVLGIVSIMVLGGLMFLIDIIWKWIWPVRFILGIVKKIVWLPVMVLGKISGKVTTSLTNAATNNNVRSFKDEERDLDELRKRFT